MKDIWVLSVRTSLPDFDECYDSVSTYYAFEQFSDARDKMRAILRDLSQENTMFDENGEIKYFRQFIDNALLYEDDPDDEDDNKKNDEAYEKERVLTAWILDDFYHAIKAVLSGNDVAFSLAKGMYSDFTFISLFSDNGKVLLYGNYDGPLNGTDPYISTNAFSMKDENDYHLYIKDQFDSFEYSTLFIDLKKVQLE